jgi:type III restriction enzyme
MQPQTAQEVIGYYSRRIAEAVKLPSQFAALAPKVREFFEQKAFGQTVDLSDSVVVKAMGTPAAHYVCVDVFSKALKKLTISEQVPTLLEPERLLSSCQPFPWSLPVLEDAKTVFNLVPCDNHFERDFAKFLNSAQDVTRFAKLPQPFGLLHKDAAATQWCENATALTSTKWMYLKVQQKAFEVLQPTPACFAATRGRDALLLFEAIRAMLLNVPARR